MHLEQSQVEVLQARSSSLTRIHLLSSLEFFAVIDFDQNVISFKVKHSSQVY